MEIATSTYGCSFIYAYVHMDPCCLYLSIGFLCAIIYIDLALYLSLRGLRDMSLYRDANKYTYAQMYM